MGEKCVFSRFFTLDSSMFLIRQNEKPFFIQMDNTVTLKLRSLTDSARNRTFLFKINPWKYPFQRSLTAPISRIDK